LRELAGRSDNELVDAPRANGVELGPERAQLDYLRAVAPFVDR